VKVDYGVRCAMGISLSMASVYFKTFSSTYLLVSLGVMI